MKALIVTCCTAWLAVSPALAQPMLPLAEAERLALVNDPQTLSLQAQAEALAAQAVSDGELPDPMLKLGAMNLPTDSLSLSQEPMTQLQVGVVQRFPRGDSLRYASQRTQALSAAERAHADVQHREALRQVRLAWLDAYYWQHAQATVGRSQALFGQLVDITRSRYAIGGSNQQDVINAELELNLLGDRAQDYQTREEQARADLARWTGAAPAQAALPPELPSLDIHVENWDAALQSHPAIQAEQAKVSAAHQGVHLAKEAYKPGWSLDLTYGKRSGQNPNGSDRPDFVSAMVMVELPFQTRNRQDRRLTASEQRKTAAVQMRHNKLLELQQQRNDALARSQRLTERLTRYEQALIPQARSNAEAAINAYQADRGDFTMLMRARITELNTELQALKLRVDRAKAQATLRYLAGEQQ